MTLTNKILAVVVAVCAAFVLFDVAFIQEAYPAELMPADTPLEEMVGRPIEFSDMTATNPVPPVDLDQLETDLLEHGWEPGKVHDIMQDLRSGQMRYNAIEDHWYGRD